MKKEKKEKFEYPVGERITYFREKKKVSTNKLANLAGVSQSYLRDVELGNKNPTVEFLYLLCNVLDITLADFFNSQDTENLNNTILEKIQMLNESQRTTLLAFLDTIL